MNGRSLPASPAAVSAKEGKAWVWPRRLLDVVGYLALALALTLLASLLTVTATNLLGYDSYVIYSGSMEPTVKVGSLLLTRPVDVDNLRVGDVVTYRALANHTALTHRIVGMRQQDGEWVFKTKGDASLGPDPREVILRGQVAKMVFDIPYLGYVVDFARSTKGILVLLVLPAAGLVGLHAVTLPLRKMRRGGGGQEMARQAALTPAAAEGEGASRRRPSRKAASAAVRGRSSPKRVASGGSR